MRCAGGGLAGRGLTAPTSLTETSQVTEISTKSKFRKPKETQKNPKSERNPKLKNRIGHAKSRFCIDSDFELRVSFEIRISCQAYLRNLSVIMRTLPVRSVNALIMEPASISGAAPALETLAVWA